MAQEKSLEPFENPIVLWRGIRGACPCCGKGRLFKSYLTQIDRCHVCHESFSDIRADDGPAWFVMLLTGAIVVPTTLSLSLHDVLPDWAALVLLLVLGIVVTLLLLPPVKGLFIAILWRLAKRNAATPGS
jgi:uncharacterized protein (DUF983 family)